MTVVIHDYSTQELDKILKEKYFSMIALVKSASSLTNSQEAKKSINNLQETIVSYISGSNGDIINSFSYLLTMLHSLRVMGRLNKLTRDIFQYLYQDLLSIKLVCDYYAND